MSQPLCGAKTRVGGTCRYPAMLGGARCRRHGGAIKRVRAAAQRRLAEEKAAKVVLGMALVPVTDPVACLRELTAETLAVKDVLLARVAQLQGDIRYKGATGEQVRAELTAYERAAERVVDCSPTLRS
ncbi:MAG: HGGxSTG domain-containing protein [Candidatus Dormiibacterota bacterium]